MCGPTAAFPELAQEISLQDEYPILFLSEESVAHIENATRDYVGQQGVDARWKDDKLAIERLVLPPSVGLLCGAGSGSHMRTDCSLYSDSGRTSF